MKKTFLTMAILTMVLGASACSSKSSTDATTTAAETTTEAPQTTEAETTTEETEDEEVEEMSMTGVITGINSDILTVQGDDDDTEKKYDISKAEITREFPFAEGDQVEIVYPDGTDKDPIPAISLEVLESVIAENTDPSVIGSVTEVNDSTLTIKSDEDDESYTVRIANAYVVAKNGITPDKKATITYIGDLDDDAMATKIVMEDSYDTAEADLNAFIGKVAEVEEGSIVLISADDEYFTFVAEDIDFSQYSTGDTLQVYYTGTLTAKALTAEDVEKK
ncbi:MAG: hypothetical protein HFG54_13810 [Lachnospiraceae bacterium]|jgi:hypothetical protein|nr:hypothetical protein [Lachnospiraceae bacterium]